MQMSSMPTNPNKARVAAGTSRWPLWLVFCVALAAVLVAYFPSLGGELLWDDAGHLTSPELQSFSGLLRIWFEPGVTQQYYPLLHSAFWLEHQIWGDVSLGYRLVNVLWHSISACLLVALLRKLSVPGSLLAGLLFALHPVCVESVAWISEQKNTLSTLFYLAAAVAWLRYEGERTPRRYAIATLWFLAALLTKTVTATLPAALLVIAWWRRGKLTLRGDLIPLVPWFAAGIGLGLFTLWFESTGIGAQGSDFELGFIERGLLAGRVFWFYLGKLAWPADLTFFYPRWELDAGSAAQWLYAVGGLALLGGLVWWARHGRDRGPLAALLLFGGTLFPVLGFVNVYPFVFSYVADHFQYLASPAMFALAAAGAVRLARWERLRLPPLGARAVAALVIVMLGMLTWTHSSHFVDSSTLYRATLHRNPDSWIAHQNLAVELANVGAVTDALFHARRAVELKPDHPEALNNLADVLTQTGRAQEALPIINTALELQPRYAEAENTLGIALIRLGRREEGIDHFRRAIEFKPSLAEAHFNLGLAKAESGDFAAAIPHFAETIRLRPTHVDVEINWGVALALSRRLSEARTHFERAIGLAPQSAAVRQVYGRVLLNAGELEGAVDELRAALRLDPDLPGLHRELASAYERLGRISEARYHATEAEGRP